MTDKVRLHYETHPYPCYPLLASVRRCDTYALNLTALWTRFNGELPPLHANKILISGCGSFAPYPFAISNPHTPITALDLSGANLKKARRHCLLHGINNVTFKQGDLLDQNSTAEQYGFIDAFGVIHHLPEPVQGLKSLAAKLVDNGIIRIMVYSRYARKDEESIRHAFRLLGINDSHKVKQLIKRSKPGSRLRIFAESSFEATSTSGLADALLHPCVKTYKINDFMQLVGDSGLKVLQFAHSNAMHNVESEVSRIGSMENDRTSPGNFIAYLGVNTKGACSEPAETVLQLNPCLSSAINRPGFTDILVPPRLGHENPVISRSQRVKLRKFIEPVKAEKLNKEEYDATEVYRKALFLLQYKS